MDVSKLADELTAIERRYAPGGDASAEACAKQLTDWRAREDDREEVCSTHDVTEAWLLMRLCGRYGIRPFRGPRQKPTTVCLRAPAGFMSTVLWPQHQEAALVFARARADIVNEIVTAWLGAAATVTPVQVYVMAPSKT